MSPRHNTERMTLSEADIARRLRLGEDSYWEFKAIAFQGDRPISPKRDDLADEIAAFANGGGGVLLCGVTDEGSVHGMSRSQMDALEGMIVELCADSIKPSLMDVVITRHEVDGRLLLAVDVARGTAQHDSPGGSFRRVGSAKRPMSGDERMRLAQQRGQARFVWFDRQVVPGTGFGTLDDELWKPLVSAAGAVNPETALEKQALLARDEAETMRATVAGVLLCTRSPEQWLPCACITATRYRGKDRASGQVDAQEITGPLDRQVADAVAFAVRNMQVSARKTPARVDQPQYSDKALFEALVNAVAHRDYTVRGSRIRLSMFADRLEIQSPGALPNSLTVDSMANRQATRNEALASALGRLPVDGIPGSEERRYFMERRGDGVPIIKRETYALCGTLPEYRLIGDAEVCLVIPAAVHEQSAARAIVTVRSAGTPRPGADLLVLFPNRTWKQATTDENGEAAIYLHTTHHPVTVFVAAPGHAAGVTRDWRPADGALAVELEALPGGGAVIFPEATGSVPGLKGRLNPVRDAYDRTHLYASDIAINRGRQQPVHFLPGEDMHLTDANGVEALVRIVDIVGRSALVEYRRT